MMNKDQQKAVNQIYQKFYAADSYDWNEIDDSMVLLDELEDSQLYKEASIVYKKHISGKLRSGTNHPGHEILIPIILEAVEAILDLYKYNTTNMHIKNRYILQYYMSLDHTKIIIS